MKFRSTGVFFFFLFSFFIGFSQWAFSQELITGKDSASYAIGVSVARSLKASELPPLNNKAFLSGVRAVFENRPLRIDSASLNDIITSYIAKAEKKETEASTHIKRDLALFETPLALSLHKNTGKAAIDKMESPQLKQLAMALFSSKYDKKYRVATFNANLKPTTLGQELMIGDGYSKYEGITGIYFPIGRHLVLVSGIEPGKEADLLIAPNRIKIRPGGELKGRFSHCEMVRIS